MNNVNKNYFSESNLAFEYVNEDFLIFFGKKTAQSDEIIKKYSQFSFSKLKQVHSDIIVEAKSIKNDFLNIPQADAHWSNQTKQALIILTADCLPILVYCHQTKRVCAIHAGWKGVANKILSKSINQLIKTGSDFKKFSVFIGPHIKKNSFEVGAEVREILENSAINLNINDYCEKISSEKYKIDLKKIVISQLNELAPLSEVFSMDRDTLSDINFHSYRREKDEAGRNISFIAKLK